MGARARAHVEQHYDWKQIALQYEEAYMSVIRSVKASPEP
jgi:glycosyltransferase involved in cell wall biosynthesis